MEPHRFERIVVRPAERQLQIDGRRAAVGARAYDVLLALIARRDRTVPRHELLDAVWPGLVVEENNLEVQISSLRKLLGPQAIATIPGRGYRWVLPALAPGAEAARDAGASVPPAVRAPLDRVPARPPLFGRDRDLEALHGLLARHALVSIVGPGGIGKTRLAQAIAAGVGSDGAPATVAWVDLAALSDPALLPSAVARCLGVVARPDADLPSTLAGVLGAGGAGLLVLDNCEHLLAAAADLVAGLLAPGGTARVLVTTQEPLHLPAEQVYRLGPLDVAGGAAAALFAARAGALAPRFRLDAASAPAVAEICARLDGIPLAIEFAAARVPLLGVEGVRARLDDRFKLLTAGARVVLRRHQTLRAALEWSHGLLGASDQAVLRRLGVFSGGFTMQAAQHVAADASLDAWAVLDHLGSLVDRSLVLAEGDASVPRYRLLETTRAFALEQLALHGETAATLERHVETLLALLGPLNHDARRWASSVAEIRDCGLDVDNLRAAFDWAADAGQAPERAIELAALSFPVWHATASFVEGLERCLALAPRVGADTPPALAAGFWFAVARLGLYLADAASFEAGRRAAALYRELGDPQRRFESLVVVACIGARRGAAAEADAALAEALALEDPRWPARQRAALRLAQVMAAQLAGRHAEALALAHRQAALYEEEANPLGMAIAVSNVAASENALGRHADALAHAGAALARLDALGMAVAGGHLRACRVDAWAALGDSQAARDEARQAWPLLRREGDQLQLLGPLAVDALRRARAADAACLLGFIEAAEAWRGEVATAASRERLARLSAALADALPAAELARRLRQGAAMPEADAFALALGPAAAQEPPGGG